MNIATETVSGVPSVQSWSYERRPLEFFGICNIICRNSLLGFLGSLNMNIPTAAVSEEPSVPGGPYERRPLEFSGICYIGSRNSLFGGLLGR